MAIMMAEDHTVCCPAKGNRRHADHWHREIAPLFVDGWVCEHGLLFAVEATIQLRRISFRQWYRPVPEGHAVYEGAVPQSPDSASMYQRWWLDSIAARVRAYLCAAMETEYQAVVDRLSSVRTDPSPMIRLSTSYLAPTRQDWLEADLSSLERTDLTDPALEHTKLMTLEPVHLLVASATTEAQLERIAAVARRMAEAINRRSFRYTYTSQRPLYGMATRFGPACAPVLAVMLDQTPFGKDKQLLAGMLAQFPTDAAYQILLERIDDRYAAAALAKAGVRFPQRAMRLLSDRAARTSSPAVRHALRLHAVAHDSPGELLTRTTRLPTWFAPALLPQILLRDGRSVVSEAAVIRLITALRTNGPDLDEAVTAVTDTADRASLAEFAWATMEAWQQAGYPAGNRWVLHALGVLGDDNTARQLTPLILGWPRQSAYQRAVYGLDTLVAIGSETALEQLRAIAMRAKTKLRRAANDKSAELAARLGTRLVR
ncbi:hypothetical protein [Nocardia sp. NBC_01327]|uniref:hypothetical protein n=1 Tax=Nocardia sp. NBC_01327 TaxID=2903593 RepID=UPI002E11F59D|nr:hypothetical protein OG326_09710 [Nocardia sp. NBC_01327]